MRGVQAMMTMALLYTINPLYHRCLDAWGPGHDDTGRVLAALLSDILLYVAAEGFWCHT